MRVLCALALMGALGWTHSVVWAKPNLEVAGDVLQILVPLAAYSMSVKNDDAEGTGQFYRSAAATLLITHGLKRSIDAPRPNGGRYSFPSGHTSAAFMGAAFVHARYSLEAAWPAYLAATLVAHSRVASQHHHTADVVAGAALGVVSSFYFTPSPWGGQMALMSPVLGVKKWGIQVTVATD
jgi:membrane-associated phospholipid phosphatase